MASPAAPVVTCANCGKNNRVPAAAAGVPRCGNCRSPLPWIADATDDSFREVVEESKLPVIVDLWAPWCGPCRMVSPALENLARQYAGRVKLVKVDVDESPAVAQRFSVRGVPTLLLMNRETVLARQVGAAPEQALRAWLDQHLPASAGASTRGA